MSNSTGNKVVDWRKQFDKTRKKITRLRQAARLDASPQYRLDVKKTSRTISIERETYRLVFDKQRAMVTEAVIDGVRLDGVTLPHLLVIDERGRRLRQSDSADGDLAVREEKFSVFLEGHFSLDGRCVPVVYEIDRMSGTTFCTMDVPAPLKVRRMTLEHSLGKTPRPLDTYYAPHHYLKTFRPYRPVVINEHKVDIIFEKDTMQLWTDGHIGLQVYSVTWDKSRVLKSEKKYRYGTGEIRNGASWIDLTFFSTGTTRTINLPDGYRVTTSFSPMPYRSWQPRSEVLGSGYLLAGPEAPEIERRQEVEAMLNHMGRSGITMMCHGEPYPCFVPEDPAFSKWLVSKARDNGIKTVLYIERSWAQEASHPQTPGMFTKQELLDGRQELPSHFGKKDNGPGRWSGLLMMCCNYEPWRIYVLTMIDYCLDKLGYDGVYLDTSFICSCANPRHGESPDESTDVQTALQFHQDLRLLLADLQTRHGKEYVIINHYWDQHSAPVTGLSDFSLPGEQDAHKKMPSMSVENTRYGYSAIPNGVDMIWYSSDTYDYSSTQIYNDAADSGGVLWLRPYVQTTADMDAAGLAKHIQHVQPLVQYGLKGSRPVHRYSSEYDKLFKGGDRHTRATLYLKTDGMLVYLVNDGPRAAATHCSVRVPASWKTCLVLNAAAMEWETIEAKRQRVTLSGLDGSAGPLPLVIRPYPREMSLLWYDSTCREAQCSVRGKRVRVTAQGVAGSCTASYVWVPKGKALARAGRPLLTKDQICVVPMVFDATGRSDCVMELVKEA